MYVSVHPVVSWRRATIRDVWAKINFDSFSMNIEIYKIVLASYVLVSFLFSGSDFKPF